MVQATLSCRTRSLWLAPIAGALVACAAQVDEDYRGEPVAKLQGTVAALDGDEDETELSAAIVWLWAGPRNANALYETGFEPRLVGERVAVEGTFPAGFSLTLYEPPPPEAEITVAADYCIDADGSSTHPAPDPCPGQLIAAGTRSGSWIGLIAAIDANTPEGELELSDIVGLDTDHLLFYFDEARPQTLPDDPTAEQVVRYRSGFDYDKSFAAGYHLAKISPEWQRLNWESFECQWEGLCVHWIDETETIQARRDWEYESCMASFPDNPTCSALVLSAEGESADSSECRTRYMELQLACEHATRDCGFAFDDSKYADNPDGLADPLTIMLGMQIWDVRF
jgi:hypothetical protein